MVLFFFTVIASIISYIDSKKGIIPDKIILPAIFFLLLLKYLEASVSFQNVIAMVIIVILFAIPVIFGFEFGGGDIRFGVFCALFIGLENLGVFLAGAGVLHLVILIILKKKSFGFAPAMSLAGLAAYFWGSL